MSKAILVGNGLTSQLIKEYYNPYMMSKMKEILGNKFNELNNLLQPFREINIEDAVALNEILRETSISMDSFNLYFHDYYLKNEISNNEISSIESLLKVNRLFEYKNIISGEEIEKHANEIYYNEGKNNIESISKEYDPIKMKNYFLQFDDIFTTNFDLVLDGVTDKEVCHLHGGFSYIRQTQDNGELHILKSQRKLSRGEEYLVWGINASEKREKSEGGFSFPMSFPISFSGYSVLQKYIDKLTTDPISELHIFGYSGENDGHINEAMSSNSNIKKIVYYCCPKSVNSSLELKRVKEIFVGNRIDIDVELNSWDSLYLSIMR